MTPNSPKYLLEAERVLQNIRDNLSALKQLAEAADDAQLKARVFGVQYELSDATAVIRNRISVCRPCCEDVDLPASLRHLCK